MKAWVLQMNHKSFLILLAVFLSACATPSDVNDMTYVVPKKFQLTEKSKYFENVWLDKVIGGGETLWYMDSQVSNAGLTQALEDTLKSGNFYATSEEKANYHLTVELLDVKQVAYGSTQYATAKVKYTLHNKQTDVTVFDEIYEEEGVSQTSDSWRRGSRVEKATEEAIRGSIHKLVDRLII